MLAKFWQPGKSIDYVNSTSVAIPANTVISLGTRVGIAGTDIAPGEKGTIVLEGVYKMTKTAATTVVTLGAELYFDGTGITTTKTDNVPAGYAVEASPKDTTEVLMKLHG